MLVDLDAGRLIDDARHFDGLLAVEEPGAERHAIAQIVEKAAAARGALVPPGAGLGRLHLFRRYLHLVGKMIEGAPIAVIIMHLDDIADSAFIDEPLGGDMAGIPGKRPVDGELALCLGHGRDHAVGFRYRSRERLLDQHMDLVPGDTLDMIGMLGRRRTDDGEIRLALLETLVEIGEDTIARNVEIGDRRGHALRCLVIDRGDFGIRMVEHFPQQIAHMHMVEIDSRHAPSGHVCSPPSPILHVRLRGFKSPKSSIAAP